VVEVVYECHSQRPITRAHFLRRLLVNGGIAFGLVVISLGVGMAGYMGFEKLSWLDAFLNTAMLLGGMGPVNLPQTEAGKLFAGIYALYAGLVFIVTAALLLTPIAHRVLHKFHWAEKD
jgi:hypothetical protein